MGKLIKEGYLMKKIGYSVFSISILHSALKLEKSAISKVQNHIFGDFKNGQKSIFAPEKSLELHFW